MLNDKDEFDIDAAIDDIAESESSKNSPVDTSPIKTTAHKLTFKEKIKDLFTNPKKRKMIIGTSLVIIGLLLIIPHSRYAVLNTVGVRSSASVVVLDESTSQPLRNVQVSIAGAQAITDENGTARVQNIKLGNTTLQIQKRAFAETSKAVTIGWGSNPLGDVKIKPVGVQYTFKTQDFTSGKPLEKIEAVSGEFSAFSNSEGVAVLTIEDPGEDEIAITLQGNGYRAEQVNQKTENKETQTVNMVPSRKHIFVSKRSGKYDVYKVDLDGKNEELVLSGTGNEREDMTLVARPDKDQAVLVSSRGSQRNSTGFLLNTLTLIDLTGKEAETQSIDTSERIQVIGWSGNNLVYVKITEGASASTPDRHKLITFNEENGQSKEIAKSNYFNDVLMVGDDIYYAPSSAYQQAPVGLTRVKSSGDGSQVLFDQEVWNIFRTDYDSLMFSVQSDWYEYDLKTSKVLARDGEPSSQLTRIYVNSPDGKRSMWIDQRDGKGTLIEFTVESAEDKTLKAQSGLTYPVVWANDSTVIYRINTEQESADYVVSVNGGEAKKITDVTNTGGVDRWYYY